MDSRSVAIPLLPGADGALDHPTSLLLSAPAHGSKGRRFPGGCLRVHDEVILAFMMDRNPHQTKTAGFLALDTEAVKAAFEKHRNYFKTGYAENNHPEFKRR